MSIFQKYLIAGFMIFSCQNITFADQDHNQVVFDFACQLEASGSDHHILTSWLKHESLSWGHAAIYSAFIIINSNHLDPKEKIAALIGLKEELEKAHAKTKKDQEDYEQEYERKRQEEYNKHKKDAIIALIVLPIFVFAATFSASAGDIFAKKIFTA